MDTSYNTNSKTTKESFLVNVVEAVEAVEEQCEQ